MTDPASKTLHIKFSEAEIRRHAEQPHIRQLRDLRYPSLLLRFAAGRTRASWLIVRHAGGRSTSTKLGNWPDLPVRAAVDLLPKKLAELTADPSAAVSVSGWATVADLLRWYAERAASDRSLSGKRKATVRSLIGRQLLPRVGTLSLLEVDRAALDAQLIWPMQATCSRAYTRQAFGLLKQAFNQASELKKLAVNPLAGTVFTDYIKAAILPKPCALRPQQLPALLEQLANCWESRPAEVMLALLMLCHGTRLSETRKAKWTHIELSEEGEWFIPAADTKTRAEHRLPITRPVAALLTAYHARQQAKGYDGAWLFPRGDGQPWSDRQASAVFERLGSGEWTSHDLRKVARSLWADLGVDYLIGELLLNHALDDLDAAYIHTHAQALKREALERWHAYLLPRGLSFFAAGTTPGRAEPSTPAQPARLAGWLQI